MNNAPTVEKKVEPQKKKEKKAATGAPSTTTAATGTVTPAPTQEKPQKEKSQKVKPQKEKKKDAAVVEEGGKKGKGAKGTPAAEDAGVSVPSMIDLRVGHIVDGRIDSYHAKSKLKPGLQS